MSGWQTIHVDVLPDPKTVEPWTVYQLPDKSYWYPDNMEGEGQATKWLTSEEHIQQWKDQREQETQTCLKLFKINEQVDLTRWNEFVNKCKENKYQYMEGVCLVTEIKEDTACGTGVRIFVQNELGHQVALDTMWIQKL